MINLGKKLTFFLEFDSPSILEAPKYSERVYIKSSKNKSLLKSSAERNCYPNFQRINFELDPNMKHVKIFFDGVKVEGHNEIPVEYSKCILDICSKSSTIALFQLVDKSLLQCILENLSDPVKQIMTDCDSLELKQDTFIKYPVLYERLASICHMRNSSGKLPLFVKSFCCSVIKFCLDYYDSLPNRNSTDYSRQE